VYACVRNVRNAYHYVPQEKYEARIIGWGPPGTTAACHPSGWIHLQISTQWLQHFVKVLKPYVDDLVVLILDGNFPHTRTLDVIELARHHEVIVVCLPPQSIHKLHELHVSFVEPYKQYYSMEIENWTKNHFLR
jgi:hypothetical protein